jgi:hypothetical protein
MGEWDPGKVSRALGEDEQRRPHHGLVSGFRARNGFKMVTKKNLDVVRARWLTAENVSKFYDVLYASAWRSARRRRGERDAGTRRCIAC